MLISFNAFALFQYLNEIRPATMAVSLKVSGWHFNLLLLSQKSSFNPYPKIL